MSLTATCLVKVNAGSFGATTNGVDVPADAALQVKLQSVAGVTTWYLRVSGTDEETAAPSLTDVNPGTHEVTSPSTVVTLTFPSANTPPGRAILFESTVVGPGGPVVETFGIYLLTDFGTRVGAVGEAREGDLLFGWASKINPLLRTGGGGGGSFTPGGDLGGDGTTQILAHLGFNGVDRASLANPVFTKEGITSHVSRVLQEASDQCPQIALANPTGGAIWMGNPTAVMYCVGQHGFLRLDLGLLINSNAAEGTTFLACATGTGPNPAYTPSAVYANGFLWIFAPEDQSIRQINEATGEVVATTLLEDVNPGGARAVTCMAVSGNTICAFTPENNQVTVYLIDATTGNITVSGNSPFTRDPISACVATDTGEIWTGTTTGTISLYDPSTDSFGADYAPTNMGPPATLGSVICMAYSPDTLGSPVLLIGDSSAIWFWDPVGSSVTQYFGYAGGGPSDVLGLAMIGTDFYAWFADYNSPNGAGGILTYIGIASPGFSIMPLDTLPFRAAGRQMAFLPMPPLGNIGVIPSAYTNTLTLVLGTQFFNSVPAGTVVGLYPNDAKAIGGRPIEALTLDMGANPLDGVGTTASIQPLGTDHPKIALPWLFPTTKTWTNLVFGPSTVALIGDSGSQVLFAGKLPVEMADMSALLNPYNLPWQGCVLSDSAWVFNLAAFYRFRLLGDGLHFEVYPKVEGARAICGKDANSTLYSAVSNNDTNDRSIYRLDANNPQGGWNPVGTLHDPIFGGGTTEDDPYKITYDPDSDIIWVLGAYGLGGFDLGSSTYTIYGLPGGPTTFRGLAVWFDTTPYLFTTEPDTNLLWRYDVNLDAWDSLALSSLGTDPVDLVVLPTGKIIVWMGSNVAGTDSRLVGVKDIAGTMALDGGVNAGLLRTTSSASGVMSLVVSNSDFTVVVPNDNDCSWTVLDSGNGVATHDLSITLGLKENEPHFGTKEAVFGGIRRVDGAIPYEDAAHVTLTGTTYTMTPAQEKARWILVDGSPGGTATVTFPNAVIGTWYLLGNNSDQDLYIDGNVPFGPIRAGSMVILGCEGQSFEGTSISPFDSMRGMPTPDMSTARVDTVLTAKETPVFTATSAYIAYEAGNNCLWGTIPGLGSSVVRIDLTSGAYLLFDCSVPNFGADFILAHGDNIFVAGHIGTDSAVVVLDKHTGAFVNYGLTDGSLTNPGVVVDACISADGFGYRIVCITDTYVFDWDLPTLTNPLNPATPQASYASGYSGNKGICYDGSAYLYLTTAGNTLQVLNRIGGYSPPVATWNTGDADDRLGKCCIFNGGGGVYMNQTGTAGTGPKNAVYAVETYGLGFAPLFSIDLPGTGGGIVAAQNYVFVPDADGPCCYLLPANLASYSMTEEGTAETRLGNAAYLGTGDRVAAVTSMIGSTDIRGVVFFSGTTLGRTFVGPLALEYKAITPPEPPKAVPDAILGIRGLTPTVSSAAYNLNIRLVTDAFGTGGLLNVYDDKAIVVLDNGGAASLDVLSINLSSGVVTSVYSGPLTAAATLYNAKVINFDHGASAIAGEGRVLALGCDTGLIVVNLNSGAINDQGIWAIGAIPITDGGLVIPGDNVFYFKTNTTDPTTSHLYTIRINGWEGQIEAVSDVASPYAIDGDVTLNAFGRIWTADSSSGNLVLRAQSPDAASFYQVQIDYALNGTFTVTSILSDGRYVYVWYNDGDGMGKIGLIDPLSLPDQNPTLVGTVTHPSGAVSYGWSSVFWDGRYFNVFGTSDTLRFSGYSGASSYTPEWLQIKDSPLPPTPLVQYAGAQVASNLSAALLLGGTTLAVLTGTQSIEATNLNVVEAVVGGRVTTVADPTLQMTVSGTGKATVVAGGPEEIIWGDGPYITLDYERVVAIEADILVTNTNVLAANAKTARFLVNILARRGPSPATISILAATVDKTWDPEGTGWVITVDNTSGPERVRIRVNMTSTGDNGIVTASLRCVYGYYVVTPP